MFDSVVLGVLFIVLGILSHEIGITRDLAKILFIVLPLLSLEPIMIALTGGSIGHHLVGIKVVRSSDQKNLGLGWCFIRYLVKIPLGIYSIVSMWLTTKHRAVHDLASKSLMIFKKPEAVPELYKLQDRVVGYDGKPSILRRVGIAFCYTLLLVFVWELMINIFVTQRCIYDGACTDVDIQRAMIIGYVILGLFLASLILSMLCKMPGARVRKGQ